ncbi:MAG: carboxypeptidase regulatory-like domain-containing protein [Bacteroidales bacterium]|nr:carboxypeptidase regulatory-like domain-containing protein [Bacteroidales bacterium]
MKNFFLFLLLLQFVIPFNLIAQAPVYFDPQALEATVGANDSVVVHTVLRNTSEAVVEFSFPGFTNREQGGPDDFGYSWIDSDEPNGPDWVWTDISETGIPVEGLGDDMVAGPCEMGFDFPFYGENKHVFWINSNGSIGFNQQLLPFANEPIPTNSNYTDFIAWFWDDLTIDTAMTTIYFKNFEEKTIVQFNKMVHYPGTESFITAQVVMMANGTIVIRYRQVTENFETNSATIGLQSSNPELGLQVSMNEAYVHSEMAVRFDLTRGFIKSVTPASLTLQPGTQETIWIKYSSVGFETGGYEQELRCVTSLPEYPELFVHNVMHVANPVTAGFRGYVTDASTGYAINDVKVKVGEHQVFTNSNGFYELPLEPGSYDVTFSRNGYQALTVEDTTAVSGYSTLNVSLGGFYFIAGRVFAGENPIETGFAYGYKMLEGNVVDIYAEMVGESGWYEFSGLSSAQYITKAEPGPGSVYYGDYLPTYYGDVIHWEDAAVIDLMQGTDDAHIHLVAVTNAPQGPGSISGSIDYGVKNEGVPVILRTSGGSVMMATTAADGTFSFPGIAYGTYQVFAEVAGKSVYPHSVTLNEANPSVSDIKMVILENSIVFLGIANSEIFKTDLLVYPNPAADMLNVKIDLKKPAMINVEILDPLGKILSHEQHQLNGQKNIAINLNSLPEGIYFLRCEALGDLIMKMFVKQ